MRSCSIGASPADDMASSVQRATCTYYVTGVADALRDQGLICMESGALDGVKASQAGVAALVAATDDKYASDSYPYVRDYLIARFGC
ncbi:Rap1a/Tai family immunity protein [Sinorhizobium meliloti]|uniref:Rap1a/Tai family immunity protein n=1 Tax=Rhizobium meliloti TaxID=382 RepID=UPI00399B6834